MKRPVIGITGKRRFGRDLAGNWLSMSDSSADVFWVMYAEGILSLEVSRCSYLLMLTLLMQ